MTNVINLNKARKAKARADKEAQAAENRRKFGRTKQEKNDAEKSNTKLAHHVDGHQLNQKTETPETSEKIDKE